MLARFVPDRDAEQPLLKPGGHQPKCRHGPARPGLGSEAGRLPSLASLAGHTCQGPKRAPPWCAGVDAVKVVDLLGLDVAETATIEDPDPQGRGLRRNARPIEASLV